MLNQANQGGRISVQYSDVKGKNDDVTYLKIDGQPDRELFVEGRLGCWAGRREGY